MARPIRKLDKILGLLNRGKFMDRCDEKLAEAIATLENLPDEKGEATLTIELKVKYQGGRVDLVPTAKLKLPAEKGFNATPFWTADGGLSVEHPSQTDMFPRDASATAEERETA